MGKKVVNINTKPEAQEQEDENEEPSKGKKVLTSIGKFGLRVAADLVTGTLVVATIMGVRNAIASKKEETEESKEEETEEKDVEENPEE